MTKKKIIILIIVIAIISAIATIVAITIKIKGSSEEKQDKSQELILYDTKLSTYVKETESGLKINTSTKLNQEKKIGELTVTGIQLTSKNGTTTLIGTVTNNTSENTSLQNIEVAFFKENGEEMAVAKGVVSGLKIGESTKINITMSSSYINAYDLEFRVK